MPILSADNTNIPEWCQLKRFELIDVDYDKYWLIYGGSASMASEAQFYNVRAGECGATGMGWHHDVLEVFGGQPMYGIYFETAMERRKRRGHLREPKHGKAAPQFNRV